MMFVQVAPDVFHNCGRALSLVGRNDGLWLAESHGSVGEGAG